MLTGGDIGIVGSDDNGEKCLWVDFHKFLIPLADFAAGLVSSIQCLGTLKFSSVNAVSKDLCCEKMLRTERIEKSDTYLFQSPRRDILQWHRLVAVSDNYRVASDGGVPQNVLIDGDLFMIGGYEEKHREFKRRQW